MSNTNWINSTKYGRSCSLKTNSTRQQNVIFNCLISFYVNSGFCYRTIKATIICYYIGTAQSVLTWSFFKQWYLVHEHFLTTFVCELMIVNICISECNNKKKCMQIYNNIKKVYTNLVATVLHIPLREPFHSFIKVIHIYWWFGKYN